RHVAIRKRIERGDLRADGVKSGKLVAGKPRGRAWDDRLRQQTLRKIALTFSECRHVGHLCDAFAQARAFVIGEEESMVFDYGAAEREAELIALIFRIGLIGGREKVAGVERAVAEEFEGCAVKL